MVTLEQLKERIRKEASDDPEKFFATEVLREKGFRRGKCSNCGLYFWSYDETRESCGEPECSGGYTFIGDSPTPEEYSYIKTWKMFRNFMENRGYTSLDRYPVVARWRNDLEFVIGSISNFQPHVVSGESEPPAEELIVPQPSLRFNDIDNVGVTGRHYVLHNHIGQTCFKEQDYDQDRYFRDMFEFAVQELGIPREKLILHEDAWGGGGNIGACMEFFVDGLELWNQVYMFYKTTKDGYEDLDLKVLDMGMGHERITWISHGTETSYECVMPGVLEKLKEQTGIEVNDELWREFLPYSGYLNIDEVDDLDHKWREIAEEMDVDVERLKKEVEPVAALYSVAEHTRALLFALADGKLPSNTGGGHNLRVIYRRAKDFIEKYDWNVDLAEVAEWHTEELEPIFPELKDSLDEVEEILKVEETKHGKARERARKELQKIKEPSLEQMIELYESHGVSPEMMEEQGIEVPKDFYTHVTSENEVEAGTDEQFDVKRSWETEKLYYRDEKKTECEAEVTETLGNGWIVLDRTVFYPEGGGQDPDRGYLTRGEEKWKVEDVQSQDDVVLHKVPGHDLKAGDEVGAVIDWDRRQQLMQHHSTTHMVNKAARELFGDHIWQAGAHKSPEKARLDITHYEKPSREELDRIENKVKDTIKQNYPIKKEVIKRSEAEKRFGFRIYQGGAVPGSEIRIVSIDDIESEACGGTHLENTHEAGEFVITGANRIQDGVIRLEYKAGKAAEEHLAKVRERVEEVGEILDIGEVKPFIEENYRDSQRRMCEILSVDGEQLVETVRKFDKQKKELEENIEKLNNYLDQNEEKKAVEGGSTLSERVKILFEAWKEDEKTVETLENMIEEQVRDSMEDRVVREEVPTENVGLLIEVARKLAKDFQASVTLIGEKGAVSASYHEEYDADENLETLSENVQGDENFAKAFDIS